jgi:hypothetical protein
MSLLAVSMAATLALIDAPYVRSRVDTNIPNDPTAHCLWWKEGSVITYQQNVSGDPLTTHEGEFDAARRSFGSWQQVMNTCGSLTFTEGPTTNVRVVGFDPDSQSNVNAIIYRSTYCSDKVGSSDTCWRDLSCGNEFDCWGYPAGTIALTTTSYDPKTGQIYDADIEMNAYTFYFSVSDPPNCLASGFGKRCADIENTLTHEIGHLVGLDHTARAGSTMQASAKDGETTKRGIDSGTASFVCETYPPGQPSRDCVALVAKSELGHTPGCSSAEASGLLLPALALWLRRRRREVRA